LLESPSNPLLQVYDIKGITSLVRELRGSSRYPLVVVDNTLCTPIFQQPLDLGTDLVLHSATKFLAGHSDTLAGVICTNDSKLHDEILKTKDAMGNSLSDFSSQLLYEGLQTLRLRCTKHMTNGI
jgi:cystathionine beta-lyase